MLTRGVGWEELFSNLLELTEVSPVPTAKVDFSPKLVDHIPAEFMEVLFGFPTG
jgi:hypothetical protein